MMSKKSKERAAMRAKAAQTTWVRPEETIFTPITLADLKENRDTVIAMIKESTNDVKEVMAALAKRVEYTEFDDVEEFTNDVLCNMGYFKNASVDLAQKNRENAIANAPSSMR